MTLGLTKEDVAKLPPEDQEAVGRIALAEAHTRREMLAAAKGYRGMHVMSYVLVVVGVTFGVWKPHFAVWSPFLFLGLFVLIHFHVSGINRRIDAVLRLMDERPEAVPSSPVASPETPADA